jgi:hypothetical protein
MKDLLFFLLMLSVAMSGCKDDDADRYRLKNKKNYLPERKTKVNPGSWSP